MTAHSAANLSEMDKRSTLHPYTALHTHLKTGPRVIVEAQGIRVRDSDGREFIDAMAGLWCVNVGWGREEIAVAVSDQIKKLAYFHSFSSMATEPSIRLADRLVDLAPPGISKVLFGNTGSDANDTNVKLVWYYNNLLERPAKKKIISRRRGYHGVTVATASLSGLDSMHVPFDLPLPQILHTETPHYWRHAPPGMSELEFSVHLAGELDRLIEQEGPETVAAFIAEPVMGAGGVIPPPEGYFQEIQAVLKKHDVLFIVDEVICGFGRLGRWFGSDLYQLEPDLMTIAKGLSSGYVPIAASLVSERVWQVLLEAGQKFGYFAHGYTYGGHPVGAAAALANLDILENEGLVEHADRVGAHFQECLRQQVGDHPLVGEVRGVGLIAAVELVRDRETREEFAMDLGVGAQLSSLCLEEGLIARPLPQSSALAFSPPLIVTREDCDEIVDRFARALARLEVAAAA